MMSFRKGLDLDDAIRSVLDGDGILFVGAGLSFLAKNASGHTLPDGQALIDLLLEQPSKTGSKHPLDRVAGHIVRKKGVDFVYELLKKSLTASHVNPRLQALYNLPWRNIYTTNYDDAIEYCLRGKRPISSIGINDEIAKSRPGAIIHLNGYIGDVIPANLQSGLVLTDQSYATSKLQDSEWLKFFLRDLRSARTIIFAGYSLADLDIQRALIADETLSRKTIFFISPYADELEKGAIGEYGTIMDGGVEHLFDRVDAVAKDYESVRFSPRFLALSELKIEINLDTAKTNVQKITEQLVYGQLPENDILHKSHVFGKQPYLIVRKQDQSAIEALRVGP